MNEASVKFLWKKVVFIQRQSPATITFFYEAPQIFHKTAKVLQKGIYFGTMSIVRCMYVVM